jgi:hypothetical protein
LLIGTGVSNEGLTQTSEMIYLNDSNISSKNFERFPVKLDSPVAGLISGETPIICGDLIFLVPSSIK